MTFHLYAVLPIVMAAVCLSVAAFDDDISLMALEAQPRT
jgi:hypothetical protein